MVALVPTPSVLIADAEYYICRVLEAKLTKDNQFRVLSATAGLDALQLAVEQSFNVLLWDMRLRDTFSLLPRLRALCPNAALFLMTTDDRPMLHSEISRLDIAGVLVKPFGLDTLVEQLRHAVTLPPAVTAAQINLTRVGQRLTLISPAGECVTRVLERHLDTFLVVGTPRVETPSDFAIGLRVGVQVHGEDALYTFDSRLVQFHAHPVPRWELSLPRVIRREQRRKHPRLPMQAAIQLRDPEGEDDALPPSPPPETGGGANVASGAQPDRLLPVDGVTEDMSLGGCCLISDRPLPVGVEITLGIRPAAQENLEGQGRVVRIQALPLVETPASATTPRYRIAVQFTTLGVDARRRLRTLLGPRA